ncbi:unnamed protein product [Acanthoscelides obtectus]|uniref:Uncharacterized protein n=1 Tax=Acanthoscelides obtectus TaxID=200917 RepID=A0A9P0JTB0_ACAOB|nr:unnamed protein product [Acanthoscelides obtectus]CAK1672358.1 hypothetical protein AOBTE_LOCUS28817 [Acanthoscelides obtectus]
MCVHACVKVHHIYSSSITCFRALQLGAGSPCML